LTFNVYEYVYLGTESTKLHRKAHSKAASTLPSTIKTQMIIFPRCKYHVSIPT